MPLYDYRCKVCGHTEEREFSMADVPEVIEICPDCGYVPMKKVLAPVAVAFKGSGFYKTDNPKTKHVRSSLKVGGDSASG